MRDSKKQVRLVVTSHENQWNKELPKANNLQNWLVRTVENFPIDLIGEEFSKQALESLPGGVHHTISQKIAKKLDISHKFCDPNEEAREDIGYPTQKQLREKFGNKSAIMGTKEYKKRKKYEKKFWHIREKYWLDRISGNTVKYVIFVCGLSHLVSFKSLLVENGYDVKTKKI